jgi:hypothetical protein
VSALTRPIAPVPHSNPNQQDAGRCRRQERFVMSDNYVIEVNSKIAGITVQAGIVVRDGQGFRFFAASRAFDALEGQVFKSPRAAEHAALDRVNTKFQSPALIAPGAV